MPVTANIKSRASEKERGFFMHVEEPKQF